MVKLARPRKQTVDYFPHLCDHGKTMFILEQKYKNDGYAFWFKLLEILGRSEGHYFILENIADWEFLQAKTHMEQDKCTEILDLLANLGAIDKELWNEHKTVWSDNFIKNVVDAYKNRRVEIPIKPSFYSGKPNQDNVSTTENPQMKLDETKQDKSNEYIQKNSQFKPPTVDEVKQYCQERQNKVNPEKWHDHYTSNGWMVGKNKMKDWKAAVRTWERNNYQEGNPGGVQGGHGSSNDLSSTENQGKPKYPVSNYLDEV